MKDDTSAGSSAGDSGSRLGTDRQVRVFISSTFRDMKRERDLLVKEVFPALRRKCAQRFVTFTEVDLRWGITAEQVAEGQVLPFCLAEIERSRPYFIGLLGERYGWVPQSVPKRVIEEEPWLGEELEQGKSVTELEILHGVLNNPKMQGLCFFYFRDPAYAERAALSATERQELVETDLSVEIEAYGKAEASRRTTERKRKLAALKQRIRDSQLPLVEPYADPEELASIVFNQFDTLIDERFPEETAPDALTRERLAHEAYARRKLFACIRRPVHLEALSRFASLDQHDGKGFVVTGGSGCGKTALFADWARRRGETREDEFLFQHYFGATPESTSPEGFLTRLLSELNTRFELSDEIPSDPAKLREALPLCLAKTTGQANIVLVLDGVNNIQGEEPDRALEFLPRYFPPHVKVIVSTLPGTQLEVLRERGWTEYVVPPASEQDVDAMVDLYLSIHARSLESGLRQQLTRAPAVRNPLFLRTVLEELRQIGSFEQLPEQVHHYLKASSPAELFRRVIARWQRDFGFRGESKALVRTALTHLWAARDGLSESEWLDLLGNGKTPLPRSRWSPFFLALEPHLVQRHGRFTFGHDFLCQATIEMFLDSDRKRRSAHLALARYFEKHPAQQEMSPRKAAELPYQLHAARKWRRLQACLTHMPLFLELFNERTQWDLARYWRDLREQGRDMGKAYSRAYKKWRRREDRADDFMVAERLAKYLGNHSLISLAGCLAWQAYKAAEQQLGSNADATIRALETYIEVSGAKIGAESAMGLLERVIAAKMNVFGPNHAETLNSKLTLVELLLSRNDQGAVRYGEQLVESYGEVFGQGDPRTLYARCLTLIRRAQPEDDSLDPSVFKRAIRITERSVGHDHPDVLALREFLALAYHNRGDHEAAAEQHKRVANAFEKLYGAEHFMTLVAWHNFCEELKRSSARKGSLAIDPEYLSEGEKWLSLHVDVSEREKGRYHQDTLMALKALADWMLMVKDFARAKPLFERAVSDFQKGVGNSDVRIFSMLTSLAYACERSGEYNKAQSYYEQAVAGREKLLGLQHPDTLRAMSILAEFLAKKGDLSAALRLQERLAEAQGMRLGTPGLTERTDLRAQTEDLRREDAALRRIRAQQQAVREAKKAAIRKEAQGMVHGFWAAQKAIWPWMLAGSLLAATGFLINVHVGMTLCVFQAIMWLVATGQADDGSPKK